MTLLQKLREAKARLIAEMRKLTLVEGTEESRALDDAGKAKWEGFRGQVETLNKQIQQEEFLMDEETKFEAPAPEDRNTPINPASNVTTISHAAAQRDARLGARSYRSLFGGEQRSLDNGGFKSLQEFLLAVHSGARDERLQYRSMNEGLGTTGGFLVPSEYAAEVLDVALEGEVVRPRASVFSMNAPERIIPGFDSADHSSTISGWSASWLKEGATAVEVDGKYRSVTLKAKKLACYTSATNELISDAMNFESMLNGGLSRTIGWFMDLSAISGNGTGQFLGFLNDPALIVVSKELNQAASTVKFENLAKIYARMHPSMMRGAEWIINQTCIPQLLTLSIAVGTGGSHIPVMTESNGVFRILGLPVTFTEKVPALGAEGDISLANFSQYAIGLRKDILIEKSASVHWTSDKVAYRAILRADGCGLWNSPVTPKNGSTVSWCVTLEAR